MWRIGAAIFLYAVAVALEYLRRGRRDPDTRFVLGAGTFLTCIFAVILLVDVLQSN